MQVFGDDGIRIQVRVDGDATADAVVLIHGFPLAHEIWSAQIDALARSHRVIAPDLRGMGKSSVIDGPYLMESLAADVAATLDALGVDRAAVVGHSLGGYVALAFTRMFSERVTHLALVCSRLAADDDRQAKSRNELADRIERERSIEPVVEAYVPRLFAPQTLERGGEVVDRVYALARTLDVRGAAAVLRGMALRSSSEDIAADLNLPMVAIAGGCDALLGRQEAIAVAGVFPRGRLVVCERSGHLPMLEEPEGVTSALRDLLAVPA
jgi:3-oxoadipate enol-lactonase